MVVKKSIVGQIENRNFLSPTGFQFQLNRAPKVAYFGNMVNIPSMQLGVANIPTYLKDIPLPGDTLEFEEDSMLTVDFSPYLMDIDSDTSLELTVSNFEAITVEIDSFIVSFVADTNWNGFEDIIFTNESIKAKIVLDNSEIILSKPAFAKVVTNSFLGGDVQVALESSGESLPKNIAKPISDKCNSECVSNNYSYSI